MREMRGTGQILLQREREAFPHVHRELRMGEGDSLWLLESGLRDGTSDSKRASRRAKSGPTRIACRMCPPSIRCIFTSGEKSGS